MQLLTVKNAAAAIQASPHTIYRAMSAGELRYIDIGQGKEGKARLRIDSDDLAAWIASRANKGRKDQVPA